MGMVAEGWPERQQLYEDTTAILKIMKREEEGGVSLRQANSKRGSRFQPQGYVLDMSSADCPGMAMCTSSTTLLACTRHGCGAGIR
jgi:hypothetical protein